jgi:hypothetical protein
LGILSFWRSWYDLDNLADLSVARSYLESKFRRELDGAASNDARRFDSQSCDPAAPLVKGRRAFLFDPRTERSSFEILERLVRDGALALFARAASVSGLGKLQDFDRMLRIAEDYD